MKKSAKKKIMAAVISIAFLASIATTAITFMIPTNNQQETWVARVSVLIFNELQTIPAGLGIGNNTTGKIYTLNYDNIIYKNTNETVRLSDVFELWGEQFNSTCIMNYCNNGNNSMVMYVNRVVNTDYELYVIKNQDDIIIDYR
jgi:hypothetical protein